jgi:PAS domain S-box-containing protein
MDEKPTYEELERRVQELEKIESELEYFKEILQVYEKTSLGYQSLDENGHFITVNQKWLDTLGYAKEEVIGKSFADFIHPDWRHHFKENFQRFNSLGEVLGVEFEMLKKTGDRILVSLTGKISRDKKGNFQQTHCIFHDITERKKVEEALNREHTMLARTEALAHVGSWEWEAEDDKVTWSEELFRIFGLEPMAEAPPFTEHQAFYVPRDRVRLVEAVEECLRNNVPYDLEVRVTRTDGQLRHCVVRGIPEQDADGVVNRLYGSLHDITERKQVEEALRESEEKYRLLFEHTGESLFVAQNGRIVLHNPRTVELTGYSTDELQSRPFMEFIQEDDREMVTDRHLQRLKGENPPARYAFRIIHKSGHIRWVELNAVMIHWSGKPATLCFLTDITEHKKAEESLNKHAKDLEKSNFFIQTILDNLPIGLAVNFIEEGTATYINNKFEEIYGWPKEQLKNIEEFFHKVYPDPEYREKLMKQVSEDIKSGDPERMVWEGIEITRESGEKRIISAKNIALYQQNLMISTVQDITDRKRAEKALHHNHEMLKLTEAMANIGSWEWDVQHDRTYWSEELFRIFGRDLAEGAPPFEEQSDLYVKEDMRRLKDAVEICVKQGTSYEIELRAIRPDDEIRHCISRGQPQYDENGEVSRITGSFQDITERKQAEEERKNLQNQLSQAQKIESVGRLAGGVAHDFNNMLGVIIGHTELALLQADENHDLYSNLKEIQTAANRSADITRQLLAFARKQTISPRQLDLNDIVESMLNMLRRLIGEDINLVWHPAAHIWPVKMDPTQIDQILVNLCINARDAISGVGKLTIETGIKSFDEEYCKEHPGFIPGDFVQLSVSDNGCGMDKDTLENLFEPFFTTKEVGKGTGLGLATIYGICKQNSGFINVYSEPGQGSTFKIYLPRLVAEEDIDKAVPEKRAAAGGTETILLVEDEPTILRMTRMMLEKKGYTVLFAATPTEAVDKAKVHSGSIDLLMTDVVMPEMNGRDLAEKIISLYPESRLLFMSGYTADIITNQGVLNDGMAFIQKPFSMADMTEKVRELLDMASDKS